nr:MAG TPA: hypothetical protein [Caudoviricetes sp.]
MIFLLMRHINMDLELFFTVIQVHAKSYYFRNERSQSGKWLIGKNGKTS